MSWQLGLFVVITLPLAVFAAAVFWPESAPKDRTVQAIRERIEREDPFVEPDRPDLNRR